MFLTVTPNAKSFVQGTFQLEFYRIEKYCSTEQEYLLFQYPHKGYSHNVIIDMDCARSMVIRDYDGNVLLDWR